TAPVKAQTALQAGHRYRLVVTGTVSDWCPTTATKQAECNGGPFALGKGVDAVWCYAARRCPAKEAWHQLHGNGKAIPGIAGVTPDQVPYNGGHSYTFEFSGVSGALMLGAADALAGSIGDNSGAFKVTISDLGGSGGGGDENGPVSAATKRLQQNLAKLG